MIGQDGLGVAAVADGIVAPLRQQLKAWNGDPPAVDSSWRSMAEYLARFDGHVSPNVACLVGHGTVRMQAMGMDDRRPSDAELRQMQAIVGQAMSDGAVGCRPA